MYINKINIHSPQYYCLKNNNNIKYIKKFFYYKVNIQPSPISTPNNGIEYLI